MSRSAAVILAVPFAALLACDAPTATSDSAEITGAGASAAGAMRSEWPTAGDPGPPFYARIDPAPPHVYSDGEWAAVFFYRDPACVRPDFNLLNFFDAPATFGCAAAVSGASIWKDGPGVGAPLVVTARGTAVPVWFFPVDALSAALAGGITIGELAAIPGRLVGTATSFNEALHPHPLPAALGGGGHPNPSIVIAAHGTLSDGRRFDYLLRRDEERARVRITFR
jgi:hypothetical protein